MGVRNFRFHNLNDEININNKINVVLYHLN